MVRVPLVHLHSKQFIRPNRVGNDVVLTRELTTTTGGDQLIDSSGSMSQQLIMRSPDMRVQPRSFEGPGDCLPSSVIKLILLLKSQ